MKNSHLVLFILSMPLLLSSCSDPKPGQYPPSQYGDREEKSWGGEPNAVKKDLNEKKASDYETKPYTDNSSRVNEAPQISQQQPITKTIDLVDPSNSSLKDSAKSDEKVSEERAEKTFPQGSVIDQSEKPDPETQETAIDKANSTNTSSITPEDSDEKVQDQAVEKIDTDAQKKEFGQNSLQLKTNTDTDDQDELKENNQEKNKQPVTESIDSVDSTQSSKTNSAKSDEEVTEEIAEKVFPQDTTTKPFKESISATKENAVEEDTSNKNSENTLEDTGEEDINQADDDAVDSTESDNGFVEKREKQ
ncbi:hypothetical protein [Nitrosomonas ureae]|uniref:Uncharacterized protein n=1 Tax=Nitrosomonas ureae TaxID=44577 RepID=A0A2T5I2E0_9PROT|nr:hypothetical protein [Nitrosomonas ureae]PTQ78002.1 hypothetical protein C8R28_10696 [Nitrosomonas ureae]